MSVCDMNDLKEIQEAYSKTIIDTDDSFNKFLYASEQMSWDQAIGNIKYGYAQWPPFSFKYWAEGMTLYKGE